MKTVLKYIFYICFLTLIFLVLYNDFSIISFIIGFCVALVSVFLTERFLMNTSITTIIKRGYILLLPYFIYLIYQIIISGIKGGKKVIKGNTKTSFYYYESSLNNEFLLNLLSNSITLTPGTITIDRNKNKLFIMQLCFYDEEVDKNDVIKLEKKLKKMEA